MKKAAETNESVAFSFAYKVLFNLLLLFTTFPLEHPERHT